MYIHSIIKVVVSDHDIAVSWPLGRLLLLRNGTATAAPPATAVHSMAKLERILGSSTCVCVCVFVSLCVHECERREAIYL
jgi:hypothetical protein